MRPGELGPLDPLAELVEREVAAHRGVAQDDQRALAVGVSGAHGGRVLHARTLEIASVR